MSAVATGSADATKSFFGRIYRFGEAHGLGILAHTVFGAAALYFAYLFFEFELSLAFVRNLGVAVTFWASLGLAFNFATINARTAESSFAGWNVIILETSVCQGKNNTKPLAKYQPLRVEISQHRRGRSQARVVKLILGLSGGT